MRGRSPTEGAGVAFWVVQKGIQLFLLNHTFKEREREVNNTNFTYTATEVSDLLGVSSSTLRKWCIALEEVDYQFVRSQTNHNRFFYERDVVVLRRLKVLIQERKITVKESVNAVLSMLAEEERTASVHDANGEGERELTAFVRRDELEQIIDRLDKQEEFNKALLEKLDSQQNYIENSIKERDERLMLVLREQIETQKQIASSNKRPWWKFWKV